MEWPTWTNVRGGCPKELWTIHPRDDIDVAVYPVHTPDPSVGPIAFHSNTDVMTALDMADVGFLEGSELLVLGFPLGLVNQEKNYVITGQGIVARILDWYEGTAQRYLIDSLAYPGSRGGPVISKPTESADAKFVGMVSAYLPFRDVATSGQTGHPMLTMIENSGLAL